MFSHPSVECAFMTQNSVFPIKSCGSVIWMCLARDRNCEHDAAINHCILYKKSSLAWSFFCISDFVICSAINLERAAIINFYATWKGFNSVQFNVMSEHNCHYGGAFTELHWFTERRAWFPLCFVCNIFWVWKWFDSCASGRNHWDDRARGSWGNDISNNWSWGRFYVCWSFSKLHSYPELPGSI